MATDLLKKLFACQHHEKVANPSKFVDTCYLNLVVRPLYRIVLVKSSIIVCFFTRISLDATNIPQIQVSATFWSPASSSTTSTILQSKLLQGTCLPSSQRDGIML